MSTSRIQEWYAERCDGDLGTLLRSQYFDTLDNPGWIVTIDSADTPWSELVVPRAITEGTGPDWIQSEVVSSQFVGMGGPHMLDQILCRFFALIE